MNKAAIPTGELPPFGTGCFIGFKQKVSNTNVFALCKKNYFFKSSSAARTAAMTNAENVHSLPLIAFSTPSTISLGNRIVLLMVGGVSGILNFPIVASSVSIALVML